MANFCSITIAGHLCRDWELRYIPSGMAVANTSIAFSRKRKDRETTTFVELTAWQKAAEILSAHAKKGDPLLVSGFLEQDNWNDKDTGAKRSKLKMVVEEFQFLSGKGGGERSERRTSRQPETQVNDSAPDFYSQSGNPNDGEDIPF